MDSSIFRKIQVLIRSFLAKLLSIYCLISASQIWNPTSVFIMLKKTVLLVSLFFLHVSKKPSIFYFITARHFLTHLFCYILKHMRSVLHYHKSFLTSAAIELKKSFLIFKHMVWYISQEGRGQQLTLFLLYFYFVTKMIFFLNCFNLE